MTTKMPTYSYLKLDTIYLPKDLSGAASYAQPGLHAIRAYEIIINGLNDGVIQLDPPRTIDLRNR